MDFCFAEMELDDDIDLDDIELAEIPKYIGSKDLNQETDHEFCCKTLLNGIVDQSPSSRRQMSRRILSKLNHNSPVSLAKSHNKRATSNVSKASKSNKRASSRKTISKVEKQGKSKALKRSIPTNWLDGILAEIPKLDSMDVFMSKKFSRLVHNSDKSVSTSADTHDISLIPKAERTSDSDNLLPEMLTDLNLGDSNSDDVHMVPIDCKSEIDHVATVSSSLPIASDVDSMEYFASESGNCSTDISSSLPESTKTPIIQLDDNMLRQQFWKIYQDGKHDSKIVIDGTTFEVMKAFFMQQSSVFEELFRFSDTIELTCIRKEVMELLIKWAYTGQIEEARYVHSLFFVAHCYEMSELAMKCYEYMSKFAVVNSDNLHGCLAASFVYEDDNLKKKVLAFISNMSSPKDLFKSALEIEWLAFRVRKERLGDTIQALVISHLHFN